MGYLWNLLLSGMFYLPVQCIIFGQPIQKGQGFLFWTFSSLLQTGLQMDSAIFGS